MQKKIVWEWEIIDESTARVKVIGGWLVHHTISDGSASKPITRSESMVFVADRDHEWHVIPPYKEERPPESKLAADFGIPEQSKPKS